LTATLSDIGGKPATAPVGFLVDGTPLSTSSAVALLPGASAALSAVWHATGKGKSHTITAIADPANVVAESNENDNRRTITVLIK
jgi:subtilase family serine protease